MTSCVKVDLCSDNLTFFVPKVVMAEPLTASNGCRWSGLANGSTFGKTDFAAPVSIRIHCAVTLSNTIGRTSARFCAIAATCFNACRAPSSSPSLTLGCKRLVNSFVTKSLCISSCEFRSTMSGGHLHRLSFGGEVMFFHGHVGRRQKCADLPYIQCCMQ